ncbi:MAG: hypothetical protein ACW99G_12590 [Candidatus Thorarchaeota archaeon]|jgi:hypothetical protein
MSDMSYEEFRKIIKQALMNRKTGLSWSQIRERRPELYQKAPANQWVRRLEQDIGLIRERIAGKMTWRLR